MASHVVVIDSTARRHVVKTTPGKHLSDVLQEACAKLSLKPDLYELKHNNKTLDLSLTIRLSGLSSGAKLNLIQGSRSPSVVSVALQTADGARLTDKVSSNTSLWQVLRRFEESAPSKPNFTQRATPLTANVTGEGAGRLCYEMPVIRVMERELSSFADLQKTLAQLGLNSGSVLLRLSYRNTQQPLEEAMGEISQYFKDDNTPKPSSSRESNQKASKEPELSQSTSQGVMDPQSGVQESSVRQDHDMPPAEVTKDKGSAPIQSGWTDVGTGNVQSQTELASVNSDSIPEATETTALQTSPIIYAAPSGTAPQAAQDPYNENDYVPTIEHAKSHQATLNRSTQNRRLKTDAELAADERERAEKRAQIQKVTVRIRFPDMTQAVQEFGRGATVGSLFTVCTDLMHFGGKEPFSLRTTDAKGVLAILCGPSTTSSARSKRLIEDLEWKGGVLVTVVWEANASMAARQQPSLKEQYRAQAQKLKVEALNGAYVDSSSAGDKSTGVAKQKQNTGNGSVTGTEVEAKLKKFLGFGGKKK